MFCYNCGKENSDNSKFCYNCGKELLHLTTAAKLVPNTNDGITGKNNIEKELQETKCTESDETIKPKFIKQILIPLVIVGIFVWLCNVFVSNKGKDVQIEKNNTQKLNIDMSAFGNGK